MEQTLLDDTIRHLHLHNYTEKIVKYVNDFYNKDSAITWKEFTEQADKIPYDDPHISSFIIMLKNDTWLERDIDGFWRKCDKINNHLEYMFLKITEPITDNESFKVLNKD